MTTPEEAIGRLKDGYWNSDDVGPDNVGGLGNGGHGGTRINGVDYGPNFDAAIADVGVAAEYVGDLAGSLFAAVSIVRMTWDTGTTDADPGAGKLRASTASITSGSYSLYIDTLDADGADITNTLNDYGASSNSSVKGRLRVISRTNPARWLDANVTSVTTAVGYRKVLVTWLAGSAGFINGEAVALGFIRAGDMGITAPTGLAARYLFSTSTTGTDPGAGRLALNNAEPGLATLAVLDDVDVNGVSLVTALAQIGASTNATKGHLRIQHQYDQAKWVLFTVSGYTVQSGYKTAAIAAIASSGLTPFANNDPVVMLFSMAGNVGPTGNTGATGPAGAAIFVPPANVAGTSDAIALTPTPALSAYAAGAAYEFIVKAANTSTAPTVAVSGLGAVQIRDSFGSPLGAGALQLNTIVRIVHDGTYFRLASSNVNANGAVPGPLDMGGNTFKSPKLQDARHSFLDKGTVASGTVTFDGSAGAVQRLQVGGALTIAFTNMQNVDVSAIQLRVVNGGSATITWPTMSFVKADGTTQASPTRTLQTSGTDRILVWSEGSTLMAKVI